jgi:hypothetical protein
LEAQVRVHLQLLSIGEQSALQILFFTICVCVTMVFGVEQRFLKFLFKFLTLGSNLCDSRSYIFFIAIDMGAPF